MYIGHGLLAFALGGALGMRLDTSRSRALALAFVAGAFGMVPDVDLAYTVYVVLKAGPQNVFPTTEFVWAEAGSWAVHRKLTHSLVVGVLGVGVVASLAAALRDDWHPGVAFGGLGATLAALFAIVLSSHELIGLMTLSLYVLAAAGLTFAAVRRGLPTRLVAAAAAIGLLSHPFGDVFMGSPPAFLYPLAAVGPTEKLALSPDPTVNLVTLFALEVGLAWAAIWTAMQLTERRLRSYVTARAVLGASFAMAALVIQPPTLDIAYHFALGTIGLGVAVGAMPSLVVARGYDRETVLQGLGTSLATVTFAITGYLLAYVALTP
ncbi:metal-dependent hydrolase [Haloarchaeobius sp. DYHT-AS-18]|uniref:metal-dependent hydrolase n=1 Tax=Haloarchaeobius sp. DYHT-AS-18 TaxID=3446117 RepID=UPI003EBDE3F5